MYPIPAIPPGCLNALHNGDAAHRWHEYAFEIFPEPFGNRKLLDIGCGGGAVAARATEKGWEVTGIDIAPRNVEALRAMGFRAGIVGLNGPFPLTAGEFSCATCIEVAEHLVLAEHAFSENSRVLRQGGKVLFTTPNNASYRLRIKALKGKAPDDEGYHFGFWAKDRLQETLESVGLRVERTNSHGVLPFIDTLTLYKTKTGKRNNIRIGRRLESLFADRFVWLLGKT
jgi:SAM-dependent methyltransferase